jgi:hypothetical protein
MTTTARKDRYRPTESKYKGGAHEMYVAYDLEQRTRGGGRALYPKVKRVYIAGDVKEWKTGQVRKKSGREVHGVRIGYEQSRKGYRREEYEAERGDTAYDVGPATVATTSQRFTQVVEVPAKAQHVHFYTSAAQLPEKYRHALQAVR